jgi:hypothetical protein
MTILEFARVFTKSFFVEFKPGNIYNNFQLNNVLQTDVEAFLELYQNLNSVEVVNCNRVPYIDKIEDGNY